MFGLFIFFNIFDLLNIPFLGLLDTLYQITLSKPELSGINIYKFYRYGLFCEVSHNYFLGYNYSIFNTNVYMDFLNKAAKINSTLLDKSTTYYPFDFSMNRSYYFYNIELSLDAINSKNSNDSLTEGLCSSIVLDESFAQSNDFIQQIEINKSFYINTIPEKYITNIYNFIILENSSDYSNSSFN